MVEELLLDERIRNWVFIPLLYVMFMMGIIRMAIQKIMAPSKPPEVAVTEVEKVQDNNEK